MINASKMTVLFFTAFLILAPDGNPQDNRSEPDSLFREGRRLFALSIEDKENIQPAINLFEKILEDTADFYERALAYLGALYTIKAKNAFFPFDKLKWAKKGLNILDKALSQAPEDIEVLFVHGTVCHNLPGIFKRQEDALRDFNKIIELLPANMHRYDKHFIADILNYLFREFPLNKEDEKVIKKIYSNLSITAGENE